MHRTRLRLIPDSGSRYRRLRCTGRLPPGALGGGPGVEAAAWYDDLFDAAKKYGPGVIDIVKSIASA